jgi:hypothetical protein
VLVSRAKNGKHFSSRFDSRKLFCALKGTARLQQIVRFSAGCCQVLRVTFVENDRFESRTRQVNANSRPKGGTNVYGIRFAA